jgi:cytochrome oxidase Cu insertion factor (SCO1/SenC/PrrC family)
MKMKIRRVKIIMILGIVVLLGGIYGGLKEMTMASQDSPGALAIKSDVSISDLMSSMNIYQIENPEPSPDFSLMSLDGDQINLSEFNGKVVLMSFWATW